MRTHLLIFATLALLGGAFVFYWRSQPPALTQKGAATTFAETAPSPTTPKINNIGPGDRPWVRMIDSSGKVSSQYRAEEYSPRPDGTVRLVNVEADFFMGEHQRLHVTGVDGSVVMHGSSTNVGLGGGGSQPSGQPSRGRLNNVKMTLLDDSLPADAGPLLTMTTNNIEFDNETFLITTGGYTQPDGTVVAPDQVPVQVRGEYDFDGRGLTLRWNDKDDRLELLEIAHGEDLRINHPSNRSGPLGGSDRAGGGGAAGNVTAPAGGPREQAPGVLAGSQPPAAAATVPVSSVNLAPPVPVPSVSSTAPSGTAGAAKKPAKESKPVYLATFEQAVRVTQGDQLLMTGDTMRIHFRMKEDQNSSTTRPSETSASGSSGAGDSGAPRRAEPLPGAAAEATGVDHPAAPSPTASGNASAVGSPSTGVSSGAGIAAKVDSAAPLPDGSASSAAPVLAADVPIVVRWTGKLRMVPETVAPPRPIPPGESVLELIGEKSPVFVFRGATEDSPASEVRCAALTYATADGSALLVGSDAFGQVQLIRRGVASSMEDDPQPSTVIRTDKLDYVGTTHTATLSGRGHAVIPVAQNPGEKPGVIDAKWSKQAVFDFLPRGNDEMAIKAATFTGDVVVTHPQLGLTAQQLTLQFAAPAAGSTKGSGGQSPTLSEVIATDHADHVHCQILDAAGKTQTVDCQVLDLQTGRTPDGRVLARQVDATGNVVAFDGMQKLNCDRVRMLLRPAVGKPAEQPQGATAGVDTSTVELERLDARGRVVVTSKDKSTAQSDQLLVAMDPDGPHVLMTGDSLCRVTDAKGNVLTGEKIVMQPRQQLAHVIGYGTLHAEGEQAKSGASGGAASGPAASSRKMDVIFADGADLDGERNQINLRGKVEATMPDSDGTINTAHGDRIRIDLRDKPAATTRVAAAPQAGATTRPADDTNLLGNKEPSVITLDGNAQVESNLSDATGILRQSELKAPRIIYSVLATPSIPAHTLLVPSAGVMLVRDHRAPVRTAAGDDNGLGTGRGATAFQWTRGLVYSEDTHKAIMSGDVFVKHVSDNAKELPVQLTSDEMTAVFEPAEVKRTSTTQPAESQALELKSMEAVGNVVVNRGAAQVNAQRIYFEPQSHWMTAQGTEQSPVNVLDENGTQSTADVVRWNTQTWDFVMQHAGGEASRQQVRGSR
jgi:lipopolysaccharide export system protein LptA